MKAPPPPTTHTTTPDMGAQGAGHVDNTATTFMSYNMTGADSHKCQWIRDFAKEHNTNYVALQEHFKTVKSTEQWFRNQFKDYSTYVVPAFRMPGTNSG